MIVTFCGVEKLECVKVRVAGSTVAMLVSLLVIARVKFPVALRTEFRVRATVYVAVLPAVGMVAEVLLRVRAGVLLFTIVTSAVLDHAVVPVPVPEYWVRIRSSTTAPLAGSYLVPLTTSPSPEKVFFGLNVRDVSLGFVRIDDVVGQLVPLKRYARVYSVILGCGS